jgi:hypothetical protein
MYSTTVKMPAISTDSSSIYKKVNFSRRLLALLRSPLWICLIVGLLVRLYLVVHTQGVIAGDEAVTGIQAEHILHGEWPVYYYGQPYMGSLEAYLLALVFAIVGPSVLALRITMSCISLTLVVLTWRFATALADAANLSTPAKRWFQIVALGLDGPLRRATRRRAPLFSRRHRNTHMVSFRGEETAHHARGYASLARCLFATHDILCSSLLSGNDSRKLFVTWGPASVFQHTGVCVYVLRSTQHLPDLWLCRGSR